MKKKYLIVNNDELVLYHDHYTTFFSELRKEYPGLVKTEEGEWFHMGPDTVYCNKTGSYLDAAGNPEYPDGNEALEITMFFEDVD